MSLTTSIITTGSDTTATSLRIIFYNILKHPEDIQRLRHALQSAQVQRRFSHPVTWKESRDLPFLDACIKEAHRLHHPFGWQHERIVLDEGAERCSQHLKRSPIIRINSWSLIVIGQHSVRIRKLGHQVDDYATRQHGESWSIA